MSAYQSIDQPNPTPVVESAVWAQIAVENQLPKLHEVAMQAQQPERLTPAQMAELLRMSDDFGPNSEATRLLLQQLRLAYQAGAANGGASAGGAGAVQEYFEAMRRAGIDLRMEYDLDHARRLSEAYQGLNIPVPTYIRQLRLYRHGRQVGQPATLGID